jgi:hypothetical protein
MLPQGSTMHQRESNKMRANSLRLPLQEFGRPKIPKPRWNFLPSQNRVGCIISTWASVRHGHGSKDLERLLNMVELDHQVVAVSARSDVLILRMIGNVCTV